MKAALAIFLLGVMFVICEAHSESSQSYNVAVGDLVNGATHLNPDEALHKSSGWKDKGSHESGYGNGGDEEDCDDSDDDDDSGEWECEEDDDDKDGKGGKGGKDGKGDDHGKW